MTGPLRIQEQEGRRVPVLFARGVILCCRPSLRANVICYFRMKIASFAYFILFFFFCFLICLHGKKSRYDSNNAEYGRHTLGKGHHSDFGLVGSTKLTFVNLAHEDYFSSKLCFRRAVDNDFLACVTSHGKRHMRTTTEQANSYSSSFSFFDLNLFIKTGQVTI